MRQPKSNLLMGDNFFVLTFCCDEETLQNSEFAPKELILGGEGGGGGGGAESVSV